MLAASFRLCLILLKYYVMSSLRHSAKPCSNFLDLLVSSPCSVSFLHDIQELRTAPEYHAGNG
jgi:hypothetical protein